MRSWTAAMAIVAAAGVMAAGCSDEAGSPVQPRANAGGADSAEPGEGSAQELKIEMSTPKAFDNTKGWQASLTWLPEKAEATPIDVAPGAGVVVMLQKEDDRYVLEARDESTGDLRWSGQPWEAPEPTNVDALSGGVPRVRVVEDNGREHVVLWAPGSRQKDDLSKPKRVVSLVIYPAYGSGRSVEPSHSLDIPTKGAVLDEKVYDGGAGLLVSWSGGESSGSGVSVDLESGDTERYGYDLELPSCAKAKNCDSNKVVALSSRGPVVSPYKGGFGVPNAWSSDQVVPPGAKVDGRDKYRNGRVNAVASDYLVTSWIQPDDADHIIAVHDVETGELRASVKCSKSSISSDDDEPRVTLSPNDRYLVAGNMAFDLEDGVGRCFAENDEQRAITLASVGDDGIAYGIVDQDDPRRGESATAVAVPVATGKPKVLPERTDVPVFSLSKSGGFVPFADGQGLLYVSCRRT